MRPLQKLEVLYVFQHKADGTFGEKTLTNYMGTRGAFIYLDGFDLHIDLEFEPRIGIEKLLCIKNIEAEKIVYLGLRHNKPKCSDELKILEPVFTL